MREASTSPDRELTEGIISRFYARIGRPAPRFLWFDGPLSCVVACRLFQAFNWLEPAQGRPVPFLRPEGGQIRPRLWSELDEHLTREEAGARGSDPRTFLAWFWGSFWSQLGRNVSAPMRKHLQMVLRRYYGGDALSVDVALQTGTLRHPELGFWGGVLEGAPELGSGAGAAARRLAALQGACGWWHPCDGIVLCTDHPRRIHTDTAGHLHAERGPALYLSNDHPVYAWHGTRVPAAWLEQREALDPSIALTWQNVEQRRAAAEIIGWTKVIERLPLRVIDVDPDPQIGTLVECDLPDIPACRFLRVRCGTGREFALSVPPEMTTARQANAWTYDLTSEEYQPEVRA